MVKKRNRNKSLKLAEQFRDLLFYQLMGENAGKKPEFAIPPNDATFAEKKGFYAELLKHAQIELKIAEDTQGESGFDLIRKGLQDGSRESGSSRDFGGTEDSADDAGEADSEEF